MIQRVDALAAARDYRTRAWWSIPVPYRQKGPTISGWPQLRIEADELPRYFRGRTNVGVLLGEPSGDLVDVDLDHPLAVELAPKFLPPTNAVFGRAGKLRSHFLYYAKGADTCKHSAGDITIVEIRSTGVQTVFPGSVHESGETIEWAEDGEPAVIEAQVLAAAVKALADEVERQLRLRQDDLEDDAQPTDPKVWKLDDKNDMGLKPGEDYSARADVRAFLLGKGWSKVCDKGPLLEHWRRPGKDHGVSASLLNGKVLFCYTSSTPIPCSFPSNQAYKPFSVYTYLEHNGDFSAAAKSLAAQGYGEAKKSAAKTSLKLSLPDPFEHFPTAALPTVCPEFVEQAASSIDCDESMVALPLIGSVAAAIGNACRIQLKSDYSEPSVIWAAIVCESGSRKSAAVDAPLRPIRRREGEEIKKFNQSMDDFHVAMQNYKVSSSKWLKKGHNEGEPPPSEPERPVCRRFTVSDVTSEALAVRLEQNPRGLLLVRDELAGFFTGLNQYKAGGRGADEAAFLAMHGARHLIVDRKNPDKPSIYVPMASLSVIGAIQPAILRRLLTRERMESGMGARFLFAYPPPRVVRWREKAIDAIVADRLATMFDFLFSLRLRMDEQTNEPTPALLPMSREAKHELWIPFHDEHAEEQRDLRGDLSAAWAKLTGYAARLSLICQLATWASGNDWDPPSEVGVEAVRAGITLAKWFSAETKRIYAILEESDEQREARELVEYVRQKGGTVSARDLVRGPRRFRQNPDLAEAELQRLVSARLGHWANQTAGEGGGRPTRVFQLNSSRPGDETPANAEGNGGSVAVATNQEDADGQGEWIG